MPGERTEITEIATGLGMVTADLRQALVDRPAALANVPDESWHRFVAAHVECRYPEAFTTAFANGRAFLSAVDGLRGRPPRLVEWKGPHQPPGDDVIPADLRIDRVFLVSCKYLSKVLLNAGPSRLFERLLVGDQRASANWFSVAAPSEFQAFYAAAVATTGLDGMPERVDDLARDQQRSLKLALRPRSLPMDLRVQWSSLCTAVATESAARWRAAMTAPRDQLHLLWRLLRMSNATYFILGTDRSAHLRLRVDSAWDWGQRYELAAFEVEPRSAGQPEVGWRATVRHRDGGPDQVVDGHVEVRWSHGRFVGAPEAKVYLDTPHALIPGYHPLR